VRGDARKGVPYRDTYLRLCLGSSDFWGIIPLPGACLPDRPWPRQIAVFGGIRITEKPLHDRCRAAWVINITIAEGTRVLPSEVGSDRGQGPIEAQDCIGCRLSPSTRVNSGAGLVEGLTCKQVGEQVRQGAIGWFFSGARDARPRWTLRTEIDAKT
jgi:hypothetical protein